jgi:hypothetical protein
MYTCFDRPPIVKTNLDIKSEILELCTLAELMESRDDCHFCEMLFSQLKDCDDLAPHKSTACQTHKFEWGEDLLELTVLLNSHVERYKTIFIGSLACKLHFSPSR